MQIGQNTPELVELEDTPESWVKPEDPAYQANLPVPIDPATAWTQIRRWRIWMMYLWTHFRSVIRNGMDDLVRQVPQPVGVPEHVWRTVCVNDWCHRTMQMAYRWYSRIRKSAEPTQWRDRALNMILDLARYQQWNMLTSMGIQSIQAAKEYLLVREIWCTQVAIEQHDPRLCAQVPHNLSTMLVPGVFGYDIQIARTMLADPCRALGIAQPYRNGIWTVVINIHALTPQWRKAARLIQQDRAARLAPRSNHLSYKQRWRLTKLAGQSAPRQQRKQQAILVLRKIITDNPMLSQAQLLNTLKEHGYTISPKTLERYLAEIRKGQSDI
ncbi:hypothetical protein [Nitrospira sp. Kam-Ns4a]